MGAKNSKKLINFCELCETLFKLTAKKDEINITNPIPKLIKIEANITAKYVFKIKAYINSITVPGHGISPAVKTKYKSFFIKFGFKLVVFFGL
jgi:hypothetical protein